MSKVSRRRELNFQCCKSPATSKVYIGEKRINIIYHSKYLFKKLILENKIRINLKLINFVVDDVNSSIYLSILST